MLYMLVVRHIDDSVPLFRSHSSAHVRMCFEANSVDEILMKVQKEDPSIEALPHINERFGTRLDLVEFEVKGTFEHLSRAATVRGG